MTNNHQPVATIVACVQTNTQGDIQQNMDAIEALIREAHAQGATFISLPENAFYMRGDFSYPSSQHTYRMKDHPGLSMCLKLAAELDCWIHVGSIFVHVDHSDKWLEKGRSLRLIAGWMKIWRSDWFGALFLLNRG